MVAPLPTSLSPLTLVRPANCGARQHHERMNQGHWESGNGCEADGAVSGHPYRTWCSAQESVQQGIHCLFSTASPVPHHHFSLGYIFKEL